MGEGIAVGGVVASRGPHTARQSAQIEVPSAASLATARPARAVTPQKEQSNAWEDRLTLYPIGPADPRRQGRGAIDPVGSVLPRLRCASPAASMVR